VVLPAAALACLVWLQLLLAALLMLFQPAAAAAAAAALCTGVGDSSLGGPHGSWGGPQQQRKHLHRLRQA
jgi:hypothetical protein